MKLVYEKNPAFEVKVGDHAMTFRGDQVVVRGIVPPHKPSSTGRVLVHFAKEGPARICEYFPGVIGAKWVEREDQPWNK